MTFAHADGAWKNTMDSVMDSTRDYGYYGDADLQEYLRRPVKILDLSWTVTTGSINSEIDPWTLFLEDANVKKRVEGYRLFQGTLHIRVAINGGPLYYAKAIATYEPKHTWNGHSWAGAGTKAYVQQLSQFPHIFLDSTTSEGGELVCPFFHHDNWIDLIGDGYGEMGNLKIVSINDLLHANSASGTVNISVYAWMENVRLAAPTAATYNTYTAQAGQEIAVFGAAGVSVAAAILAWLKHCKTTCTYTGVDSGHAGDLEPQAGDEYGTGIVSKPASAVAKIAGALSNIPAIKPFARPTEMIASAVGRVAHVFGFSRPATVEPIKRFRHKAAGNLANTDQEEAITKLSLDSKQELTVDPRTVGLSDVDEMSFDYIKQKEAYLTTYEWSESDGGGVSLGIITVGPAQMNTDTIGSNLLHFPTPMYTAALPFEYWRGSIKFRFQLVASQLHRGRMRIVYDPYDPLATSPGENVVYSRVVDLATNRDFEMEIAWNHARGWLNVRNLLGSGDLSYNGTITCNSVFDNGTLRLEVVNELTSPDPALAQPVYINVFVSAGEDFEVAGPSGEVMQYCEYEPQSGEEYEPQADGEELIDVTDGIPESPSPIEPVGREESPDNHTSHVFFGESFRSIRALLKRYCYHQSIIGVTGQVSVESNFPVEPGQSVSPRHVTGAAATPASTPYNYTNMTYLNWFTPCYLGWRGGLRSKYIATRSSVNDMFAVIREPEPVAQSNCGLTTTIVTGTVSEINERFQPIFKNAGHEIICNETDGALEVEFPFYSHTRFAPARLFLDGTDYTKWFGANFGHSFFWYCGTTSAIQRHVAAGDDFSLFFFVGQPGLLYRQKPTTAAV